MYTEFLCIIRIKWGDIHMYKIGLTGGIASGKSTVLRWLQKQKVPYIDADVVAREVVKPGTPGLQELADAFGPHTVLADGTLDRAYVGSVVFSDPKALERINAILQPHIRGRIQALTEQWEAQGERAIVYDIPLLFETDWHTKMDEIWLVYVNPATQLERLMKRNGYSEQEALDRIHSQMSLDEKRALSTVVIDNSGTMKQLEKQLRRLWNMAKHHFQKEEL